MDLSVNNTVNTGLAMRDAQLMQEVQARVARKAINAQADTVATLMQSPSTARWARASIPRRNGPPAQAGKPPGTAWRPKTTCAGA